MSLGKLQGQGGVGVGVGPVRPYKVSFEGRGWAGCSGGLHSFHRPEAIGFLGAQAPAEESSGPLTWRGLQGAPRSTTGRRSTAVDSGWGGQEECWTEGSAWMSGCPLTPV